MPSRAELRDEVVRLKEQGLSFSQIGAKLGFSKQRAHQIFERPPLEQASSDASTPPSRTSNGLTVRQRKFAVGLSEGKNQRQAAIDAGVPPGGADAFAQRTLNNDQFCSAFDDLLERVGLTEEKIAQVHLENLAAEKVIAVGRNVRGEITEVRTAPDFPTRQRAVADGWRLHRRMGSHDGEGNDASRIQIRLTMETIRKVENLTGRKILPVDFQPVEESAERESREEAGDDAAPPADANGAHVESATWADW